MGAASLEAEHGKHTLTGVVRLPRLTEVMPGGGVG